MVKVLLMVIGLLVLSIGGLGGLLWNAGSQSIDPQTEAGKNYAQSFKSTITGNCKRFVNSQLGRLAKDEEVQDTVRDICKCAADMTYNNFKDQPPIKLASLVLDPKAHAKMKQITQECLDRADIPRPEEFEEAEWRYDSEEE
jgi:hypothetical protein